MRIQQPVLAPPAEIHRAVRDEQCQSSVLSRTRTDAHSLQPHTSGMVECCRSLHLPPLLSLGSVDGSLAPPASVVFRSCSASEQRRRRRTSKRRRRRTSKRQWWWSRHTTEQQWWYGGTTTARQQHNNSGMATEHLSFINSERKSLAGHQQGVCGTGERREIKRLDIQHTPAPRRATSGNSKDSNERLWKAAQLE